MVEAYLKGLIFQLVNIQFFWKMDILSQQFLQDLGWVSPSSLPVLLPVVLSIAVQLSYVTAQDAVLNSLLEKIQFQLENKVLSITLSSSLANLNHVSDGRSQPASCLCRVLGLGKLWISSALTLMPSPLWIDHFSIKYLNQESHHALLLL